MLGESACKSGQLRRRSVSPKLSCWKAVSSKAERFRRTIAEPDGVPQDGAREMTRIAAGIPAPPVEPVLDMDDIQGIAVPGFFKPHQTLLYVRVPEGRQALLHFKAFLGRVADEVSSAGLTLSDRRRFRSAKLRGVK